MLNRFECIGYLGSDPKFFAGNGDKKAVATVNIATETRINGEDITEWNKLVFFGKQAEVVAEKAHKGSLLNIAGKLVTRKYTDKQGNERSEKQVLVNEFYIFREKGQDKVQETSDVSTETESKTSSGYMDDLPF